MKTKVDFGEKGVLTWKEAFNNADINVVDLLEFSETLEEDQTIFNTVMAGHGLPEEME